MDDKVRVELVVEWGSRKRVRCTSSNNKTNKHYSHLQQQNTAFSTTPKTNIHPNKLTILNHITNPNPNPNPNQSYPPPTTTLRDLGMSRSSQTENRKIASTSSSPEKEDRYYTTRGSAGLVDESAKVLMDKKDDKSKNQKFVWPKLYISLSSKEKEEDFMAMKGCKLPHRPKKRAKVVQRTLHLVSPGAWLSDLCQERYEVREKKASKKRPRGLKAMGGIMESDSE